MQQCEIANTVNAPTPQILIFGDTEPKCKAGALLVFTSCADETDPFFADCFGFCCPGPGSVEMWACRFEFQEQSAQA